MKRDLKSSPNSIDYENKNIISAEIIANYFDLYFVNISKLNDVETDSHLTYLKSTTYNLLSFQWVNEDNISHFFIIYLTKTVGDSSFFLIIHN